MKDFIEKFFSVLISILMVVIFIDKITNEAYYTLAMGWAIWLIYALVYEI